jgi:hypothetical protein
VRQRARVRHGLLASLLVLGTACSGDDRVPAATTAPVPENVVPEDAADIRRVTLAAGDKTVELTAQQHDAAAPLLTARILQDPLELSEYGLDRPVATVTYERDAGPALVVRVGSATFDARGVYVMRDGDRRVFMALAEQLRPLLALVGVRVPPPT